MKDNVINKNNPFSIPDLTPMHDAVKAFVKEHQGEKGFILTDNPENDTIWAICYDETQNSAWEPEVKAVRVDKYGCLQVVVDNSSVKYDEASVAGIPDEAENVCGYWLDVQYDDYLYYIPTIFNIAENIEEYVEEPKEIVSGAADMVRFLRKNFVGREDSIKDENSHRVFVTVLGKGNAVLGTFEVDRRDFGENLPAKVAVRSLFYKGAEGIVVAVTSGEARVTPEMVAEADAVRKMARDKKLGLTDYVVLSKEEAFPFSVGEVVKL